jgi:arabinofuranosyltransferase
MSISGNPETQETQPNFQQQPKSFLRAEAWYRFIPGLPVLAFLCLFAVILIRRAWICDDAYITFRTVDNFINGYRLVYNVGERVQGYTHPLWFFIISLLYFFTHEIYFTVLILSIVISVGTLYLLARSMAVSDAAAALCIFLLTLSKAFMDFSTSGLENALSHLILVIFFLFFFKWKLNPRRIFFLSLIASLGIVNRMDLGVVFLPALLYVFIKSWNRKTFWMLVLGQAPFILWEISSIIYYGFPFPNTAYAKLNTGISSHDYIVQGFLYLLNSLEMDPLTLLVIAMGVVSAFGHKEKRYWMAALGTLIYLVYVVKVGGDFMSGRFLTVPLMVAVILLSRYDFSQLGSVPQLAIYGAALALALSVNTPTLKISDSSDLKKGPVHIGSHRILDERMLYYGGTGLMNVERDQPYIDFYWAIYGENARVEQKTVADNYGIGLFGYYAGPSVYVLDRLALVDPLLARIPAQRNIDWRTGHMERTMPAGYLQTLLLKQNSIEDPDLHRYYDKLSIIVKGNLFSFQRFVEIWKMNTGQYNDLIHGDGFRYPDLVKVDGKSVAKILANGTACGTPDTRVMKDSGIEVKFSSFNRAKSLQIGLDHNDTYQIVYYHDQKELAEQFISTALLPDPGGISARMVQVPAAVSKNGFNRVRIFPQSDDGSYCLGYLAFPGASE